MTKKCKFPFNYCEHSHRLATQFEIKHIFDCQPSKLDFNYGLWAGFDVFKEGLDFEAYFEAKIPYYYRCDLTCELMYDVTNPNDKKHALFIKDSPETSYIIDLYERLRLF